MPLAPRLCAELRAIARQRIRDGLLPVKFSLADTVQYDGRRDCHLCEEPIEARHARFNETDDGSANPSIAFHIVCHAAWQLECLKHINDAADLGVLRPEQAPSYWYFTGKECRGVRANCAKFHHHPLARGVS